MKLLIIGGTKFLGPHLTRAALARNHEVTHFNRGSSVPTESDVEWIQGDRRSDLVKLRGRKWDAVVDTCGYLPDVVRASAKVLTGAVERYVFISSQSAYADVSQRGVNELAPLATLTDEQLQEAKSVEPYGENYGKSYAGLKALCEQEVLETMQQRAVTIRPGLIVGPDDPTDRFTYWVERVARGGEVLAPGNPAKKIQFIDVRDLAEWIVRIIEQQESGTYNASGQPGDLTMADLLNECQRASKSDAVFTWASEEFLLKQPVMAWSEMPLWLPEDAAPHLDGFMFINIDRALSTGLTFRSLNETVIDTLTWYRAARRGTDLKAGISADREKALLQKWHEEET